MSKPILSFDDILEEKIKVGKSQMWGFLTVFLIWMSDGAEMFIIGIIMPIAKKEWSI